MTSFLSLTPALILAWLSLSPATAAQSLPDGDEIARRVNAREDGNELVRSVKMELINRRGKRRVRHARSYRKYLGLEKRTVVFFTSPSNIKGTAFLTYDYPEAGREDDQWLYLPALGKVRRISAAQRGDYFLGTDFSHEDIKTEVKLDLEDYTRKTLRQELVDGHTCLVLEEVPVSRKVAREIGYGRVLRWVDAEIWIGRKAEFWDLKGRHLKTMHLQDIRQVQDIWTVHRTQVDNHKTGHTTVFTFTEVDYATGIDDEIFTQRALRRGH